MKESGDRFQKTIIFCVDVEHVENLRQALVNENAYLVKENHKYIMRITEIMKNEKENLIVLLIQMKNILV